MFIGVQIVERNVSFKWGKVRPSKRDS